MDPNSQIVLCPYRCFFQHHSFQILQHVSLYLPVWFPYAELDPPFQIAEAS